MRFRGESKNIEYKQEIPAKHEGTGIPRIIEECKENRLPEPKFEDFGDGVKATLFRKASDKNEQSKK